MKINVDLGQKGPDSPMLASSKPSDEPYYPSFHYDGDEPLNLPKEGTMVVKYIVRSETESNRDGKDHYSCTIDVKSIVSAEGSDKASPGKSYTKDTEDALDKLAEERSGKTEKDEGEDY